MKNKNIAKFVFLLGLGAGISSFANANSNSCIQLERLCKMGNVAICNVYVRTCL